MKSLLFLFFVFFFGKISSFGLDWPTYGGPQNNHTSQEKTLRLDWGDEEPDILWKHEVGLGYSSVIEVDGLAYTQGYKNKKIPSFVWMQKAEISSGPIVMIRPWETSIFRAGVDPPQRLLREKFICRGMKGHFSA